MKINPVALVCLQTQGPHTSLKSSPIEGSKAFMPGVPEAQSSAMYLDLTISTSLTQNPGKRPHPALPQVIPNHGFVMLPALMSLQLPIVHRRFLNCHRLYASYPYTRFHA